MTLYTSFLAGEAGRHPSMAGAVAIEQGRRRRRAVLALSTIPFHRALIGSEFASFVVNT
jgi:hypothetical protein